MGFRGKFKGATKSPPRVSLTEVVWSWVGAFLGMGIIGWLVEKGLPETPGIMLVGSLGASGVLLYGAPKSPLAQPRNVIGGHVVSALVGVASWKVLHGEPWLAGAVAVSTATAFMHLTRTLHPPGGATALIAVIGGEKVHSLGFLYAIAPIGLAAFVMVIVALAVNNLAKGRRYPEFWV